MLMAGKEGNTCRQAFDFDSVGVRWAGVLGTGMRDGATTLLCPCDILVLVNGFQTSRCCVVEVGDTCNQEVGKEIFMALKEQFFLVPETLVLNLLEIL